MAVRVLTWICRLILGGIFLFAAYTKLRNPFLFEMAVDAYQLLPATGVILVARSLPWLEVALGVLLLTGWKLSYVSTFTSLLLAFFLTLMASSFSRGVEASCGCFGVGEPISAFTLARDSVFFGMAVFLAVISWQQEIKTIRERRAGSSGVLPGNHS